MARKRILVVGRHEDEGTVFIYQSLARTRHKMLAESCGRAAEVVDALLVIDLVVIHELHPDSFEAPEHNAAWLTDIIVRVKPNLKVMILTNALPAADLYRRAAQAGAVMVAKQGLDRQKFLAAVSEQIPEE